MKPAPLLTVFTPAYNRAHTIGRTYDSLCRQTSKDFCWLVIDDGSQDNTAELVNKWVEDGKIDITYIYQQNQGMHGAHNTAYRNIHTELCVCIDSDDFMPDDAVETIAKFWRENGSDRYAGMIGLDKAMGGDVIGTQFPYGMKETTLLGYYEQGGAGDKKIIYRTNVMKNYPEYPIFEGEKYVGLAYKYYLIDDDFKLLTLNKTLCIVEYQIDGSSMSMYKQYWNNPRGFAFYRITRMQKVSSFKRKFIECIHYVSSSLISKDTGFLRKSPYKLLTLLAVPFGGMLALWVYYNVRQHRKFKF